MKKLKKFTLILAIMLIITALFSNINVFATDVDDADTQAISEDSSSEESTDEEDEIEVYEGDLFVIFGEEDDETAYVMDKYVDGNVFIIGDNVTISGQINGSLFVLATNLVIESSSYIACNVFACAETISMSGFTYNMYAACVSFGLGSSGVIYRDFDLVSEYAYLIGTVRRDFNLVADEIIAYEDEDTYLTVYNNFSYTSGTEIENIENIAVYGTIYYEMTEEEEETTADIISSYIYDAIQSIVFVLIVYFVLIFLTPKFVEKTKEYISTRALLAGAIGIAFMILLPIIAFVLLFAYFGTSLAILAVFVYCVVLMINSTVVTIAINEFVSSKIKAIDTITKKTLLIIPIALVMYLIRQIPYVGFIVSVIVILVGTGIEVLYQFDKRKKEKVSE